jgi:hypothetical protein
MYHQISQLKKAISIARRFVFWIRQNHIKVKGAATQLVVGFVLDQKSSLFLNFIDKLKKNIGNTIYLFYKVRSDFIMIRYPSSVLGSFKLGGKKC